MIPNDLLERIEQVENRFDQLHKTKPNDKIAVFDLDNTLLIGDIGDALFAQLKIDERDSGIPLSIDKKKIPLTWPDFRVILERKGKEIAYPLMTTAMAGIPENTVIEATRRVMSSKEPFLEVEGVKVPVPSPNPVMQALVLFLKTLHYNIYIISATNLYSVQLAAREFFGIPDDHVFAMRPGVYRHDIYGNVLCDYIDGPVTVTQGKVDTYKKMISNIPPSITGGDSTTDIPMLNLTDPDGLIIWVKKDMTGDETQKSLMQTITNPGCLYFLDQAPYPY
jgi:phosphoserine phosphatase